MLRYVYIVCLIYLLFLAVVQLLPNRWLCTNGTNCSRVLESSWNVMVHSDAREAKWRGNCRLEWVASTLHSTSEHGVSTITTADAHTSAASSRLNWRPRRFKWTRPFRRKTKSGFCACAITFQLVSNAVPLQACTGPESCRRVRIPNSRLSAYENGKVVIPTHVAFTRQEIPLVESSWNVMAHGDAPEGQWRGNWRMEWVASTLHTTSEHGVSSITKADAHNSAASSRLNWLPRRFK